MYVGEFVCVCVCGEQTVGVPDILNTILCLTHIQNNLRPAPRNPRPWLLRRLRYAFWRLCCVSLLLTEPGFGSLSKTMVCLRPAPRNPRPWLLRRLRYAFWRLCCVSLLLTEPGFGSLSKRWCASGQHLDE